MRNCRGAVSAPVPYDDIITCRDIAQQIFLTLADREEGLGDNPSVIWTNSNEIDRFKEILSMEW